MIDITLYHWVWYLIGLACAPALTAAIFVQIHLAKYLPVWFLVWMWIAVLFFGTSNFITINSARRKR